MRNFYLHILRFCSNFLIFNRKTDNMILNPDSLYMSKSEKILFSTAIFIHFVFSGVLAFSMYFGLPNAYISGVSRIIVMLISFYLFFDSLVKRELGDISFAWPFFLYAAYCVFLLMITNVSGATYGALVYGRFYFAYIFLGYSIAPFLLFLMPSKRFFFLANNPWLVYLPSLISMALISIFYSEFYLGIEGDGELTNQLNRAHVSGTTAFVFVMSLYYIVLAKGTWKIIMGALSMILVAVALSRSSSQSMLVSAAIICIVLICFSFREKRSLIKVCVGGAIASVSLIPLIFLSEGFNRLVGLLGSDIQYTGYSRIDLVWEAWDVFMSSPILGGNLYLPDGSYSHFFPSDVLMVCGIFGFPFLIYIFYMLAQSFFVSLTKLPLAYAWMVMLISFVFVETLLHGNYGSAIMFHMGIALTLYKMYRDYPNGIPDLSDDAQKAHSQGPMRY